MFGIDIAHIHLQSAIDFYSETSNYRNKPKQHVQSINQSMTQFHKPINATKKAVLLWEYREAIQSHKATEKENAFLSLKVSSFKVYFIRAFKTNKVVHPMLCKQDLAVCYVAIWFCLSWILTIKHLLKTLLVKPFLNNCGYYLLIVIISQGLLLVYLLTLSNKFLHDLPQ